MDEKLREPSGQGYPCPNCGSTNTRETHVKEWCNDCGWSQKLNQDQ